MKLIKEEGGRIPLWPGVVDSTKGRIHLRRPTCHSQISLATLRRTIHTDNGHDIENPGLLYNHKEKKRRGSPAASLAAAKTRLLVAGESPVYALSVGSRRCGYTQLRERRDIACNFCACSEN